MYVDGGHVTVVFSSIDGNSVDGDRATQAATTAAGASSARGATSESPSRASRTTPSTSPTAVGRRRRRRDPRRGRQQRLPDQHVLRELDRRSRAAATDNGGGAIHSFGDTLISSLTIAGNHITNRRTRVGAAILSDDHARVRGTRSSPATPRRPAGNCAGIGTFTSGGLQPREREQVRLQRHRRSGEHRPAPRTTAEQRRPDADAGAVGRESGGRRGIVHRPRRAAIDHRSARRGAAAAGGRKVRHRGLRIGPERRLRHPTAPAAVPGAPAATSTTGASFSGSVNPEGQATTVFFQYGIDSRSAPAAAPPSIYDQSTTPQTAPGRLGRPCRDRLSVPDWSPMRSTTCALWPRTPPARRSAPIRRSPRRRPGAAAAGARPEGERQAGQRPGVHPRRQQARAAHRGRQIPSGAILDTRARLAPAHHGLVAEAQARDRRCSAARSSS